MADGLRRHQRAAPRSAPIARIAALRMAAVSRIPRRPLVPRPRVRGDARDQADQGRRAKPLAAPRASPRTQRCAGIRASSARAGSWNRWSRLPGVKQITDELYLLRGFPPNAINVYL